MNRRDTDDAPEFEDILETTYNRVYQLKTVGDFAKRKALSVLPDVEREELDLFLSSAISEEETEQMVEYLRELEELLADNPRARELLDHLREDVARTAIRCIELSYRYGKRRGHRECLDLLIPYISENLNSLKQ